jgi:hypothetical protein
MAPFGRKSLLLLLLLASLTSLSANPILEQLNGKPIVFIGKLGHREAVVHADADYYYVVYYTTTAWGVQVNEILQVHKESQEKAQLYVDPQSRT